MKNKGFTLVELLAVIAILAVLVIIAMPNVLSMFNQAKLSSFVTEVQKIMDTATTTFTKDALTNSGKTVYYSSESNNKLNPKKLDMSGNEKKYFIEMDRNGNFKRVVVYDSNYCYDIYTTYGSASNGDISDTKTKIFNEQIRKETVTIQDVWESSNDDISISMIDNMYKVYGCGAETVADSNGTLNGNNNNNSTNNNNSGGVLYDVLMTEANNNGIAKKYTASHNDSFTEPATKDIYYVYAKDDNQAKEALNKINVSFANYCWQIIRTTDTGGVKIIYNGLTSADGKCTSTKNNIGYVPFNYYTKNSLAYVGYMYGDEYFTNVIDCASQTQSRYYSGYAYYTGGLYNLASPKYGTIIGNYSEILKQKYMCETGSTCDKLEYVQSITAYSNYSGNHCTMKSVTLTNGVTNIATAYTNMLQKNIKESYVKQTIETWFQNNLLEYSSYMEDTIYCNERNAGNIYGTPWYHVSNQMNYQEDLRFSSESSTNLKCNLNTDKFSTQNSVAKLKYPIGLPTLSEMNLLNNKLLRGKGSYWLLTPFGYDTTGPAMIYEINYSGEIDGDEASVNKNVRPVISLKPGTTYVSGNGSTSTPYVIQ